MIPVYCFLDMTIVSVNVSIKRRRRTSQHLSMLACLVFSTRPLGRKQQSRSCPSPASGQCSTSQFLTTPSYVGTFSILCCQVACPQFPRPQSLAKAQVDVYYSTGHSEKADVVQWGLTEHDATTTDLAQRDRRTLVFNLLVVSVPHARRFSLTCRISSLTFEYISLTTPPTGDICDCSRGTRTFYRSINWWMVLPDGLSGSLVVVGEDYGRGGTLALVFRIPKRSCRRRLRCPLAWPIGGEELSVLAALFRAPSSA